MLSEAGIGFIGAFLIGAIPFGWMIARLWGVGDIRKSGSTNIGATNVVRTAGVVPGALTFLLDFAKGLIPVLYFPEATVWTGALAVAGHCFSPFLKFKGGKGVSTTLGVIFAINPWLGGVSALVYGGVLAVTRVSALGSLFAMLTALGGTLIFAKTGGERLAVAAMVIVVLARHRSNWEKLLASTLVMLALLAPLTLSASPLVDFRGKPVDAKVRPARIVALMPSLAEAVAELGAVDRLIGAPEYSRLPGSAHAKSLGPYNRISAEAVYALHPDLVLASMDGNEASLVRQLEELGARVVTVNTQSLKDIVQSMELVAAAVGKAGDARVRKLKETLLSKAEARASKSPRRVFVQIGWEPLVTVSGATFIDELVRRAGGVTIFADAPMKYPRPNPEEVIAKNPDVIVICRLTDAGTEARQAQEFWGRFGKVTAVKTGQVHVIPGDWLTKPGFELLRGMEELEKIL
jgi:acyl-phosphate glycerol 3-phosphate acyltransferase